MTFNTHAKPGMPAIMKWLGDRIETDDVFIKSGTYFKIHDINSDMIQPGFCFGALL